MLTLYVTTADTVEGFLFSPPLEEDGVVGMPNTYLDDADLFKSGISFIEAENQWQEQGTSLYCFD